MSFRFTPNPRFAEELRRDPEYRRFTMGAAQAAADVAKQHMPGDEAFMMNGAQPHAESTDDGAALVLEGPGWGLIEFGSRNNAPYAPLRKGIEAAGMTYKPT